MRSGVVPASEALPRALATRVLDSNLVCPRAFVLKLSAPAPGDSARHDETSLSLFATFTCPAFSPSATPVRQM